MCTPSLCPPPEDGFGVGAKFIAVLLLPFGIWVQRLASSVVVGTKGAAGCGVMLEAGARRCLLIVVPLHVPAGRGLPLIVDLGILEPTQLCVVGGRWEQSVVLPLFLFCFCGGHGNYCREQRLLGYDMRVKLSTLRQGCSSSRFLCSDNPGCLRSGMRAWWSEQQLNSSVLGAQLSRDVLQLLVQPWHR